MKENEMKERRANRQKWSILVLGLTTFTILFLSTITVSSEPTPLVDPVRRVYLPYITLHLDCPITSTNVYAGGYATQFDIDNPVRPAYNHADKNIALRGYTANTDPTLRRYLIDYGVGDPALLPQFHTLFSPPRYANLTGFYQAGGWLWDPPPDPGTRGDPITFPEVSALGLEAGQGEILYVPTSGYDIGGGMEVIVLFADEDTLALRYTREDSSGSPGYTLHIDNICTDPSLLALYNTLDDPSGDRYVYVPPENRPYSYDLPNIPAGYPIGTARNAADNEVVIAITDTGGFLDPRSCNDWWVGYPGSCPPAKRARPVRLTGKEAHSP
jgi:hypothetical protein